MLWRAGIGGGYAGPAVAGGRVYVTDRQLAACYSRASLFALPALFEGFGIPALEAMSHGVPVVCSRAGALPEVCADAALYFDPTDLDSITSALSRGLSDDVLRDELTRKGRARAADFSWRASAEPQHLLRGLASDPLLHD